MVLVQNHTKSNLINLMTSLNSVEVLFFCPFQTTSTLGHYQNTSFYLLHRESSKICNLRLSTHLQSAHFCPLPHILSVKQSQPKQKIVFFPKIVNVPTYNIT